MFQRILEAGIATALLFALGGLLVFRVVRHYARLDSAQEHPDKTGIDH